MEYLLRFVGKNMQQIQFRL